MRLILALTVDAQSRFDDRMERSGVLATLNVFDQSGQTASILQSQRRIAHTDIGIVDAVYDHSLGLIIAFASHAFFQRALEDLCLTQCLR